LLAEQSTRRANDLFAADLKKFHPLCENFESPSLPSFSCIKISAKTPHKNWNEKMKQKKVATAKKKKLK